MSVVAETPLDRATITALDASDMLGAIESLPDQLVQAYGTARAAFGGAFGAGGKRPPSNPNGLAICGMGGSAIGGDLVVASLPELALPATVVRGYALPSWIGPDALVILASYSGDTEETLACAETAVARGCVPVCVASGGRLAAFAAAHDLPLVSIAGGGQPRASLGKLAAPLLAALEAAGLCASQATNLDETVALLRRGIVEHGPDSDDGPLAAAPDPELPPRAPAKGLARLAYGRQVVVYGAGSTVAAARRWKGQINENAKAPAFANELPELDHNEIMGWTSLPALARGTLAVFLNDGELDRRLLLRAELTAAVLAEREVGVEHVWAHGATRLARLFSLVQLGDYVSYYLALLYGVDPTPVAAIQDFKAKLMTAGLDA
ncbi:MAG: bifunctional phosphoglucose/phosphomannose isomerase [Thermoleophilia bacterium]